MSSPPIDSATAGPRSCRDCVHFRAAPYQTGREGCYLPENMVSKQKADYLDEQQLPGNHAKINIRGDCKDFEGQPIRAPLWKRLFNVSA